MITRCIHCNCFIETRLGELPPGGENAEHIGTFDDPKAPGDWDNICDQCNYGKGLPGGPTAVSTWGMTREEMDD